MAELADALVSGTSECTFMWVQVPSSAPELSSWKTTEFLFLSELNIKIENLKQERCTQSERFKVSASASVGASVLCTEVSTGHPHPVIRTRTQ